MTDNCGNCSAYHQIVEGGGVCRARPPVSFIIGMAESKIAGQRPRPVSTTVWPEVGADMWCREWDALDLNRQVSLLMDKAKKMMETDDFPPTHIIEGND
jgi:hypothetical protein